MATSSYYDANQGGVPFIGLKYLDAQNVRPGTVDLLSIQRGHQIGADIREARERREMMAQQRSELENLRRITRQSVEYTAPWLNNLQRAIGEGISPAKFIQDQLRAVRSDQGYLSLDPLAQSKVWDILTNAVLQRAEHYKKTGQEREANALLKSVGLEGNIYDQPAVFGQANEMLSLATKQSNGQIFEEPGTSGQVWRVGQRLVPRDWVVSHIQQNRGIQNIYQAAQSAFQSGLFDAGGNWAGKGGVGAGTATTQETKTEEEKKKEEKQKSLTSIAAGTYNIYSDPKRETVYGNEYGNVWGAQQSLLDDIKRVYGGDNYPAISSELYNMLSSDTKQKYNELNKTIFENYVNKAKLESQYARLLKIGGLAEADSYLPIIEENDQKIAEAVGSLRSLVNSIKGM